MSWAITAGETEVRKHCKQNTPENFINKERKCEIAERGWSSEVRPLRWRSRERKCEIEWLALGKGLVGGNEQKQRGRGLSGEEQWVEMEKRREEKKRKKNFKYSDQCNIK